MTAVPGKTPDRWSRLIVTRPAGEADVWVQTLLDRGWPAVAWPLIDIGPPQGVADLAALQAARAAWPARDALMFVSAAAVQHFFADSLIAPSSASQSSTRFWCPGPGTARALAASLERLGEDVSRIDAPPADAAQFDSEHLWPVVQHQLRPGFRLLVVRGRSAALQAAGSETGNGREWLMARCTERGARVDACVAYERRQPAWDATRLKQARRANGPDTLWLFSSSEALIHLRQLMPDADWSRAEALCTHERIAQTARDTGFGRVRCSRPALADVLRTLESTQETP